MEVKRGASRLGRVRKSAPHPPTPNPGEEQLWPCPHQSRLLAPGEWACISSLPASPPRSGDVTTTSSHPSSFAVPGISLPAPAFSLSFALPISPPLHTLPGSRPGVGGGQMGTHRHAAGIYLYPAQPPPAEEVPPPSASPRGLTELWEAMPAPSSSLLQHTAWAVPPTTEPTQWDVSLVTVTQCRLQAEP